VSPPLKGVTRGGPPSPLPPSDATASAVILQLILLAVAGAAAYKSAPILSFLSRCRDGLFAVYFYSGPEKTTWKKRLGRFRRNWQVVQLTMHKTGSHRPMRCPAVGRKLPRWVLKGKSLRLLGLLSEYAEYSSATSLIAYAQQSQVSIFDLGLRFYVAVLRNYAKNKIINVRCQHIRHTQKLHSHLLAGTHWL